MAAVDFKRYPSADTVAAAVAVATDPEYLEFITRHMQDTGDDVTKASVLETAKSTLFYIAEANAAPPSREELQTIDQVAARLQVTGRTVRNLLASGKLPSYPVTDGKKPSRRIDPGDVDAYLAKRRQ